MSFGSNFQSFVRSATSSTTAMGDKKAELLLTRSEALPITIVARNDGIVKDIIEGMLLPEEFEQEINPLL